MQLVGKRENPSIEKFVVQGAERKAVEFLVRPAGLVKIANRRSSFLIRPS
jgi:hypothetical protein